MSTFILKWNPAISSFTMEASQKLYKDFPFVKLNWSVWDYEHVKPGDTFYMLRVGEGNIGIVMKGVFESRAKRGEDWSGKGRTTFYCDLYINFIVDSETMPIITADRLERDIPDFDWRRGHSGVMLTEEQADKLDRLFNDYQKSEPKIAEDVARRRDLIIQQSALDKIEGHEFWYKIFEDYPDEESKYTDTTTHDCANIFFSMDYQSGEFKLSVVFRMAQVLKITCKQLFQLKTNLSSGIVAMDYFKLYKPYSDAYVLESNGLTIVCGEISFDGLEEYGEDGVPATI
jgi:hypothetical protein